MLLFGHRDDSWLRDQEEYCNWDSFEQWFTDLSEAWQSVLEQDDKVLGLVRERGRQEVGHYRGFILSLLSKWETEVNEILDECFSEFADMEDGKEAKLFATKKR
mmetsp:Transcript_26927/g.67550  ORF Transcript_26927/g.67550 Transcript_26927/m.67550 type:complete len:104 (+) Transcript_26927:2137-2448(+)